MSNRIESAIQGNPPYGNCEQVKRGGNPCDGYCFAAGLLSSAADDRLTRDEVQNALNEYACESPAASQARADLQEYLNTRP